MKRYLQILTAIVFALMTSLSAASASAANGVQVAPKTTAKLQQNIEVHNSVEFFKALKSNVTIKLLPGDYNMETVVKSKYVNYGELTGDFIEGLPVTGAILKNLKNVKIVADSSVLLYSSQNSGNIFYDNVLILNNCSNITFENITFGHVSKTPDSLYSCIAGVLALYNCKTVTYKNCDVFGCGYVGFSMGKCTSITIHNSKIHDCEASAVWLNKCKKVSIYNTEMYQNGVKETWYKLGVIKNCAEVLLYGCSIHDNGAAAVVSEGGRVLFDENKGELSIDQCIFANNKY